MNVIKPKTARSIMCKVSGCNREISEGHVACDYHWKFLTPEMQNKWLQVVADFHRASSTKHLNALRDVGRECVESVHNAMRAAKS